MKEILVKDILKICQGTLIYGSEETACTCFEKDTRQIKENDVFVGIKGDNFDGNNFYAKALENGAAVCILQGVEPEESVYEKYPNCSIVIVEDTIKAIGKIAQYKRSQYQIPVVAVTGSVGKTSTKDVIASVVGQKYKVLKTQGNFNNHIGLPFTILGLKDEEALVVEMGMNHFGEISYLTNIAKPTVAVITNIGTSHIGNLGSRENILKAKLEILEALDENGTVIVNNDNDLLHKWVQENTTYNVITFGIENKSDVTPWNIEIHETYSTYKVQIDKEQSDVKVPVSGKHFVYNSCAAIAVGRALDISKEKIIKGIETFELTKKRMDTFVTKDKVIVINDSYNASLDSMKSALEYLKDITAKRKIAVLGNMLELGEFSKELHQEVGKEVVKNKIDILITIGDLAKDIAKEAIKQGINENMVKQFKENKEAIFYLKENLKAEDAVLLKASNAMNFTQIAEEI